MNAPIYDATREVSRFECENKELRTRVADLQVQLSAEESVHQETTLARNDLSARCERIGAERDAAEQRAVDLERKVAQWTEQALEWNVRRKENLKAYDAANNAKFEAEERAATLQADWAAAVDEAKLAQDERDAARAEVERLMHNSAVLQRHIDTQQARAIRSEQALAESERKLSISEQQRAAAEECAHQCKEEAWALQSVLELLKAPGAKDGKVLKPWERVEELAKQAELKGRQHAAQRIVDVIVADHANTIYPIRYELAALVKELNKV